MSSVGKAETATRLVLYSVPRAATCTHSSDAAASEATKSLSRVAW